MSRYHEPVFLDSEGRRCGEPLPHDKGAPLDGVQAADPEIVALIRTALRMNRGRNDER